MIGVARRSAAGRAASPAISHGWLVAVTFAASIVTACSADVDLGGSADAGSTDGNSADTDAGPPRCGALTAPSVPSTCEACDASNGGCQPNGCYNGYWCNASARDCQAPPRTCD